MEPNHKQLLRAAESIRAHLFRLSCTSADIYLPEEHWNDCQSVVRQLRWAAKRGWNNCQTLLNERLEQRLTSCVERLQQAARQLSMPYPRARPPALGAIFGELCALSDEFDGCAVDLTNATVSVTTEPVVLEDIVLGPFEIRLDWTRIGERRCYRVIALEPNAACEASDVTHPHVKAEQLCEGEGQESIRRALLSGRLSDFFQIANQILATYNGGSAYTALFGWEGVSCGDCGQFVSEDDCSSCEHCDQNLCLNCLEPCVACEYRYCHSCTDPCQVCDVRLCRSCRRFCDRCDRVCCASCLSETNFCGECQDQENDEDTLDQIEESTPETAEALAPAARISSAASQPDPIAF